MVHCALYRFDAIGPRDCFLVHGTSVFFSARARVWGSLEKPEVPSERTAPCVQCTVHITASSRCFVAG